MQEDKRQDHVLKECEEFRKDSWRLRDIEKLKASGKTRTRRINPRKESRKSLKIVKGKTNRDNNKTEGIDQWEIEKTKAAGEYLRCA